MTTCGDGELEALNNEYSFSGRENKGGHVLSITSYGHLLIIYSDCVSQLLITGSCSFLYPNSNTCECDTSN